MHSRAPDDVRRLIEAFSTCDAYALNETQVREQYINHFFEALGWNLTDPNRTCDVVLEDRIAVRVGPSASEDITQKAPDYGFYLGSHNEKDRKFYVEAKRPAIDLASSRDAAFQLRRYAWSAGLPLSILTDFEEFAVYDCNFEPSRDDAASVSLEFYCRYTEYDAKWREIAALFSRDAVAAGSLEQRARQPKRGHRTVDKAFLEEIASWRLSLAKDILRNNPSLGQTELNFATQQTIDRIVFLRIAEERGIEDYARLQRLCDHPGIYRRLLDLYDHADRKYNSGLFHFRTGDREHPGAPDSLTPTLNITDEVLRAIIGSLYWPKPYAFAAIPAHVIGQVYEQFLGDVVVVQGARCSIETKPEVRKSGGVFYTPDYIIEYIVRETLGPLVNGKEPRAVSKMRVVDPACGSGSFLIGAYQFLLDWHLKYYSQHNPEGRSKGKRAVVFKAASGEWALRLSEKRRILLNNIYGVDIDSQAVEVAKLSLLLKLLENEADEFRQRLLFTQRVLPDLGTNIRCGNSLIGTDFYDQASLSLAFEDRRDLNPFSWTDSFPEIMQRGGFDAVIGNPPYIRIQRIEEDVAKYLFQNYESPVSKIDLSLVFLEQAVTRLVNPGGFVGFICTSQWMSTNYGRSLRGMFGDGRLHRIIDFDSLPVFEDAQTYPAIFILRKRQTKEVRVRRLRRAEDLSLAGIDAAAEFVVPVTELGEEPWLLGGLDLPAHLDRAGLRYELLSSIGKAYIGAKSGRNEAFVLTESQAAALRIERGLLKPYAKKGGDVDRYRQVEPHELLIYPYHREPDGRPRLMQERELREQFPRAYEHLLTHKNDLRNRKDSRKFYARGADWYRHLRAGTFSYVEASKLTLKGIALRPTVGLLSEGNAFDGARCPCIVLDDLKEHDVRYFLGVLNSKALAAYLNRICPPKLNGYVEFSAKGLGRAPMRLLDLEVPGEAALHDEVVSLVDALTELYNALDGERTPARRVQIVRRIRHAETKLDQVVYRIYGLSKEQTAAIEVDVVDAIDTES